MRSSLFRLNAFAICRRLAAFFLLFSFEITARSQTQNATIFTSEKTVNSGQTLTLLNNGTSGVNGTYFTNYGTVQADGNFQVGTTNWAVFYQNAGTFNVNGFLSIARDGGSGSIQVNGGRVNVNSYITVGENGSGSIGIYGGEVYASGEIALSGNGGSTGTIDLSAGQLVTSLIRKGGGTGNLSFNGGTLKATQNSGNFISGLNSANIGGNGAVIDNNGKEIGINQALTGSGSGSVKFDGSGRTTLRQNNTYTGDTLVRGGTLVVDTGGSIASSSTIISSGATVQGAGSIEALTVESGGAVKITTASTTPTAAWNTEGTINFNSGSKIDVTGLTLSQQPYVLIRGSSVTGTPTLQGATGFTVSNTDNSSITLTPIPTYTYTIADGQATITKYNGTGGVVEIPATIGGFPVTGIGDEAFKNITSITSLTLPNSLTAIGQKAFEGCTSMTAVTLPNSVATIGDFAFAGCSSLTSITLPTSLTSLSNYLFQGCGALTAIVIPNGVITIGANAFADCAKLAIVTLPDTLKQIKSGAFYACPKLTSITIPYAVTTIEVNAFSNCSILRVVNFEGPYPSIDANSFSLLNDPDGMVSRNAKGYYLASESGTWNGKTIVGLTLVPPDTQSPVITLTGANPLQIYKGVTFSDPGATVTDNRDVTRSITGTGTVNTATVEIYTLNYNATDAAGNLAVQVTRTVNVVLDPSGDEDGDALANGAETSAGTNPYQRDSDSDGVSDGAEVAAGTNPLVKNILRFQTIDMLALGKGNFSIPESNGAAGGATPAGFRFGTAAYYGGVPFFISNQANQVWHAAKAPGGDGSGQVSVTFPMAVNNVYGFYTLAGLWWGVAGSYVTYTFNFSDGSSYSKGLINNEDLRDYNVSPSFANIINGTTTQNVFVSGNYHLDRQWIDFSAAGHGGKNLVSFTVTDRGAWGSSRIFLAAATAQVGAPGQIPPGATDTDGDGILDSYELGLPLSTKPDDADTDDDGLSDGIEVGGVTDPLKQDTDNDGLKDGEEVITYGTNPVLADTDGDGARDDVEVAAGTNPKLNSSLPKPVISIQPVSITNTAGGSATFSVTATNPAGVPSGLTYQWKKSTNIISGQTNQTLNLASLTVVQSGSYSVVVANIYGSTNSTVATLTVTKANPTITVAPTATPIVYGQTLDSSILSGGVASVEGLFTFTTPSTAPNAGTASQGVTFRPSDTANYNTATALVNVTVNQALISSGFSHTLYLGAGATTVTAWGLNADGRLGVGNMDSPVNWAKAVQGIPVGATVDGLAAGGTHSLILANGKAYAAGSDRFGQLGQRTVNGANKTSFTPVAIPSSTAVGVAAGGNHSLIVTASGKVFAFGDNFYGQLAQPATTASSGNLVEVNFPGLSTKIVSVVAGADHNLAVDENGGVWVWGRNDSGQLGKNTRTLAERTPGQIISSGAKSAAAGFAHSLVLKQDGTVLGFGRNTVGQTGHSSGTSYAKLPTPISELSGIRSIAAGTDSSFAIDGEGKLRSWGYNAYGELLLGYASPTSSPEVYGPKPSPIATNVFNVSGGGYSSLAVGAQGVIFGGRNDVGQAGNGPDPDEVVGDYFYEAGNLALTNLTMDLAGTTETLYDQIFVGNGAMTLNGILNLMFVGTYTGPVYGSTQTFDLIWVKNGIVFGTEYQLAFNQAGYLVESAVADKIVEGVSGKVLQATVRAVVTAADLAKAVNLARPSLDRVESISYTANTVIRALSVSTGVEMIYSYERPTGGVMSGAEYIVGGTTYRVEQVSSLTGAWGDASVSGTTVTPLGNGYERATLRINATGSAGFLRLTIESLEATEIGAGVGSATSN
jgi:autotransporter-associated beta strand protein